MKRLNKNGNMNSNLITGFKAKIIRTFIRMNIIWIALRKYRNPVIAFKLLRAIVKKRRSVHGNTITKKYIKAAGRYFWGISSAGWPSRTFDRYILNEFNRINEYTEEPKELQTMIFSITSRCPLKCEHCYEWNNLSAEETLSLSEIIIILNKFQSYGINNIQFSGGEPLTRFKDLIIILGAVRSDIDSWILTSGFGLTLEKAKKLKAAGLTGVVISLDHWKEDLHNKFRKHPDSFHWVMKAAKNAFKADLVVSFSLCAMKEFISKGDLDEYFNLAVRSGVGLIRILEPRKVGHFKGKNIELEEEQIDMLNRFYLNTLSDVAYKHMPIMTYPGYHQRTSGCYGAGNRYLYVDSKGDMHACPFCQSKTGNALTDDLKTALKTMEKVGCHKFKSNTEE